MERERLLMQDGDPAEDEHPIRVGSDIEQNQERGKKRYGKVTAVEPAPPSNDHQNMIYVTVEWMDLN